RNPSAMTLLTKPPFLSSLKGSSAPPTGEQVAPSVTGGIGQPVGLSCKASGSPEPHTFWVLPDGNIVRKGSVVLGGFIMQSNGSLFLPNPSLRDTGHYRCVAVNQYGSASVSMNLEINPRKTLSFGDAQRGPQSASGRSTKIRAPLLLWTRPPRMQLASYREVTIHQGGEVHLECQASGVPTPLLSWVLPDRSVLTPMANSGNRISMYPNGTLHISSTLPSDRGAYRCVASNSAGAASASVRLHMSSLPPVIQQPREENLLLAPGGPLYAHCTARGAPPPTLRWRTPDGALVRPSQFLHGNLFVLPNGTLHIRKIGPKDAGSYECTSFNAVGTDKRTVRVEMKEEAQQAEVIRDAKNMPLSTPVLKNKSSSHPGFQPQTASLMSITNGETLRLPCSSSQAPKNTLGSLSWTFPSGKVVSRGDSGESGRYLVQEDGTLVIHQTSVFDRGTYTCRSTSPDTSLVSVVTVPVIIIAYPPRITTGPSPVTYTRPGVAVELPCLTIATPRAMVTWETPDMTQLRVLGQARIYGNRYLSPRGSLVIQKPSSRDTGFYRCTAKNVIGVDTKTTYLHVI
uniref:Ig-like domain-containing protein n=1 Tax=Hippocampus comes TaxID=109280 RepID=A0A3Q3DHN4_HIPCM